MPYVSAECLSPDALRRVSRKCHRRGNCTVAADQATFGDPCLPGTKKQLRVSYTCGESYRRAGATGEPLLCSPMPRRQGMRLLGTQGAAGW